MAGAQNIPVNPVVNSIAAQTKSIQIFAKYFQSAKDFYGLQQTEKVNPSVAEPVLALCGLVGLASYPTSASVIKVVRNIILRGRASAAFLYTRCVCDSTRKYRRASPNVAEV